MSESACEAEPGATAAADLCRGDRASASSCTMLYPLPWSRPPLSDILFAVGWLALAAVVALFFTAVRTHDARQDHARSRTACRTIWSPAGRSAITRNPIYLANTLLMIGVGLISGITWFLLLAVIAAFRRRSSRSSARKSC